MGCVGVGGRSGGDVKVERTVGTGVNLFASGY